MLTPSLQVLTGEGNATYTEHVGYKFLSDGSPKPFSGNTFLCHIPQASDVFAALVALQNALKAAPEARYYSFLPPESFHMTVFVGVNDAQRMVSHWPRDLALETPVDDVTKHFKKPVKRVLEALEFPPTFKMRPTYLRFANSLRLVGATADEEAKLREVRDTLARRLHHRLPDHETYGFHITLSYQIRYMSLPEAENMLAVADAAYQQFADEVAEISLGALEFCQFADMHAFIPQL